MIICLLFALSACSDEGTEPTSHDAGGDTADVGHDTAADTTDDSGDVDTGPDCVCDDAADPCCDGCDAVDVGEDCDDGLDCTLGTVCTSDGACDDPIGSPCDDQVEHPDCTAAECDEIEGCSFEPVREGLDCETDTDELRVIDGVCEGGECVGTTCTCDAESECCDGCVPVNEGADCDDGDEWTIDETCQAGHCVGVELECDDEDGPCCEDGFFVEADTVCDEDPVNTWRECTTSINYVWIYEYPACDGESSTCDETHTVEEQDSGELNCSSGKTCDNGWCI